MPTWFEDNRHFGAIAEGLRDVGMSGAEVEGIMGGNWARFFDNGFGPLQVLQQEAAQ
jgi:microsomal dipeptidase-like Zn-dependent dipeptidase